MCPPLPRTSSHLSLPVSLVSLICDKFCDGGRSAPDHEYKEFEVCLLNDFTGFRTNASHESRADKFVNTVLELLMSLGNNQGEFYSHPLVEMAWQACQERALDIHFCSQPFLPFALNQKSHNLLVDLRCSNYCRSQEHPLSFRGNFEPLHYVIINPIISAAFKIFETVYPDMISVHILSRKRKFDDVRRENSSDLTMVRNGNAQGWITADQEFWGLQLDLLNVDPYHSMEDLLDLVKNDPRAALLLMLELELDEFSIPHVWPLLLGLLRRLILENGWPCSCECAIHLLMKEDDKVEGSTSIYTRQLLHSAVLLLLKLVYGMRGEQGIEVCLLALELLLLATLPKVGCTMGQFKVHEDVNPFSIKVSVSCNRAAVRSVILQNMQWTPFALVSSSAYTSVCFVSVCALAQTLPFLIIA